jgi:hypothetical protein
MPITTSDAIADTIANQYAAAMDNAIDDAARMETQRDEARAQLTNQQLEARVLKANVLTLAKTLDEAKSLLGALGARELAGVACGPVHLLSSGWVNPRHGNFTEADADEILEEVLSMQ